MFPDLVSLRPEHALARGLVERLAPLLPEPLVLQAKGSVVRASCPNGLWVEKDLALLVNQSGFLGTRLERASERILDMVQDFVTLNTQAPWPAPEDAGSTRTSYMPLPGVSIRESTLHLWYGEQPHPVIELPPLPLPSQDDRECALEKALRPRVLPAHL